MSAPDLELQGRFDRLRTFGALRRRLRVAETDAEVAQAAQRFVLEVLGCTEFSAYCAEKEDTDYRLLSTSVASGLPEVVERGGDFAKALGASPKGDRIVLPLRASPEQHIGFLAVAGERLDTELLDEIVFDVESVLAARMLTRLRAEELAVLEIQERELVGLLRDVEARDAIIQRDLEEARQFQLKMLGVPPRVPGASIEVIYQPLGRVGGDLYAVSVEENRLRLFVADATGHGVRASLTTMFIKSGYEAVRVAAPEPAAVLFALNDAIANTYKSAEMLFSAVCVDVDLQTGRVWSSSAAHPPICVVRSGEATFLEGGGAFLGLRPKMRFSSSETHISPGDGIYLFTDGFSEARRKNVLFGDERMREAILAAHAAGAPAGRAVVDAVTAFLEGDAMDDDGTFIGMRLATRSTPPAESPPPSTR